MPSRRSLLTLCLFFALVATVALSQEQDVEGSKDHPLVSRYPGSLIVAYEVEQFDEFDLPVAPSRQKGDTWDFEKVEHLEGKVTIIEYQFPAERSILEVFRNYQSALSRAGFQVLFTCRDQQCGLEMHPEGLGFWAGWDNRYLAAKLARPEGDVYVGLNVLSEHAYLVVVEIKPMESGLVTVNAAALAGDLSRTGHVAVYGIYFDTGKADLKPESDPTLAEIAKLLKQNPTLKLHVVGHTDSQGDLAMNMDLSKRRAAAVVAALTTKHGIAVARLRPDGVGPLAPVASNKTEEGRAKNRRVELVEQ